MIKPISILGSTGSIGTSTLDIVRQFPDRFSIVGLSCHSKVDQLLQQIHEFQPQYACVANTDQLQWLEQQLPNAKTQVVCGKEGLKYIASHSSVELVVSGIVGAAGLEPTYAAIEAGHDVALANKEPLVLAGQLMVEKAAETGSHLLPTDSEHNAIYQSLVGHRVEDIEKLILTASGGPFRDLPLSQFSDITVEDALDHPNWKMGPKITIDSATMMNKGLEIIEAHWLFGFPVEQIEVVIHRQSIIHSMVQYIDGSFIAQLGLPDMRVPIAYCLAYPERLPLDIPKMQTASLEALQFESVSTERFPCLNLAWKAAQTGGSAPAVLNGANEVVVAHFLNGRLPFVQIAKLLEAVLSLDGQPGPIQDIPDAITADQWGREQMEIQLKHYYSQY